MGEHVYNKELIDILNMLHSLTKMDIRYMNESSTSLYRIVNHAIPVALHQTEDVNKHIHDVLQSNEPGHYYHYMNTYGLEYMAASIWRNDNFHGHIVIGPFLSSLSAIELVKDIIVNNNLPISERHQLEHFYESLPILSESEQRYIGRLLGHLCIHNEIRSQQITTNLQSQQVETDYDLHLALLEENKKMIEERYEAQNELMHAIRRGDKDSIKALVHQLIDELVVFSDRVPGNPIRALKNIGFVFNTMSRIAAEQSGVHPIYLHNISERFAILIEKTFTIPQLKTIFMTMGLEYCDLVNTVATGKYSPVVKKAIDYILLNLGGPLPLKEIAAHIPTNPSHLSRKFKEDTGVTITDFINLKRVQEAAVYLRRGNTSVTDVAFLVGFNDLNYFSKVFKKIMNVTPSQFVRSR